MIFYILDTDHPGYAVGFHAFPIQVDLYRLYHLKRKHKQKSKQTADKKNVNKKKLIYKQLLTFVTHKFFWTNSM